MLMGDKPVPWENLQPSDRKRLGEFRKPVLQLLNRNPDQRPTMSQFYDNCNAIFFSNTTTKIGDALSAPPEAAAPLDSTASDADHNDSTPGPGTATGTGTATPMASGTAAGTSTAEGVAGAPVPVGVNANTASTSGGANNDVNSGVNNGVNSSTSKQASSSAEAEGDAEGNDTAAVEAARADVGTEQATLPLDSNLKIV